jgi:prevent-host-death family protein
MSTITAAKARDNFSDILGKVSYAKERITLTRRGRAVAAVIPIEDLELLEAIEDHLDAKDALAALEEWERSGEPSVPWEQVKKDLGL